MGILWAVTNAWLLLFCLYSVAVCRFSNTGDDWYVLVGVAKDLILNPRSVAGGFVYTYKLVNNGEKLEFLHKVGTSQWLYWILDHPIRLFHFCLNWESLLVTIWDPAHWFWSISWWYMEHAPGAFMLQWTSAACECHRKPRCWLHTMREEVSTELIPCLLVLFKQAAICDKNENSLEFPDGVVA